MTESTFFLPLWGFLSLDSCAPLANAADKCGMCHVLQVCAGRGAVRVLTARRPIYSTSNFLHAFFEPVSDPEMYLSVRCFE